MSDAPATTCGFLDEGVDEKALPSGLAPVENLTRDLLRAIGEDPNREGLLRTPNRVARAWEFLSGGYRVDIDQLVNDAVFEESYEGIVSIKNIDFYSLCEHHLLPFWGKCTVAYMPSGRVIGLSKLPRIVDMFARRLQIQERFTKQIADCLTEVLQPKGVAVVVEAYHMCMMMRGVQKQDSRTLTSEMTGIFKECPMTRNEFLSLMNVNMVG